MPNTPKLVEERLDDAIDRLEPYFKELYKSGSFAVFNLKVAIKKEMTQELATLKAQVRKEIEELKLVKPQKDNGLTYPVGALHKAYNDALDQALSILKDNHES